MIDQWFKNDLENIYANHTVAVFIDESGDAEFLLKTLGTEYTILQANTELEELYVKYLIEKVQPSQEKFLIYTCSKKDRLKFIREYCETCGCLEIRYLQNYIKDKVHQTLNLNINLSRDELIAAAKVSVGKDRTYWMDISHKGATEIFDLSKELLPFVHDPDSYSKDKYDAQLRETFYRKVNELLRQDYLNKPASTLAGEVVKAMFDGLVSGYCDKTLESVYKGWLDSFTYRDSFNGYLNSYAVSSDLEIWNVSINHPFRRVDERWLAEIGKNISGKPIIPIPLDKLRQRNQSRQAQTLGISFWSDVIVLLEFDPKDIAYLNSFSECIEFYQNHFYKLDTAIRNLYTEFLNRKELLEPFQELYKEHLSIFLDKWFKHWSSYKETQTGILQRIIDDAGGLKTAVIVGDGVAYEVAELVAAKVKGTAKLKKDSILADIPSETENNMSRIYLANGATEAIQSNREKYLVAQNPNVSIDFIRLDEVTDEARLGQILICTYKDIDDMGEKLQQKALKFFPEIIEFFAEKIAKLLNNGYAKVYLISDHGFVLTGILNEHDKISITTSKNGKISERYICSGVRLESEEGLYMKERNGHFLYFANSINPFKSVGCYGYSHGGITPQELITPYFCWEQLNKSVNLLTVKIINKDELKHVTGEIFQIKIKAGDSHNDPFSIERKISLVFFANKKQVNRSDIFTVQDSTQINKDFSFDGKPELEVILIDAETKETLDKVSIKQGNDRNLTDLF